MTELQLLEKRRELLLAELSAIDLRTDSIRNEKNSSNINDENKPIRMLTIREAASESGLSYDWIRKMCIQGKLKYVCIGQKRLINADSLRAYLQGGEV